MNTRPMVLPSDILDPLKYITRRINRIEQQMFSISRQSGAAFQSIEAGDAGVEIYDDDGNVTGTIGGTGVFQITNVGTVQPTAPDVTGIFEALVIAYDGTFEDGDWTENLVDFVEIHAMENDTDTPDDTNQIGTFTSSNGGTFNYPWHALDGGRWIVLVAVLTDGTEGDPSDAVFAVPDVVHPTDGQAPQISPEITLEGGIRSVIARWEPVDNPDPVTYFVYAKNGSDPDTGDPPNDLVFATPATSVVIDRLPDGTPIDSSMTIHVGVAPTDADGIGPASDNVTATPIQIDTIDISPAAVETGNIASGAITTGLIALGAITTPLIGASQITSTTIADGSITTPKLVTGAVTANEIAAGTITATQIQAGTITGNLIAAQTIAASKLVITNLSNLIDAGDFEGDVSSWGGDGGVVTISTPPVGGTKAWQFTGTGGYTAAYFQPYSGRGIGVVPGESYYFSAKVRVIDSGILAGSGNLSMDAIFKLDNTSNNFINVGAALDPSTLTVNTWYDVGGMVTVPAGANEMTPEIRSINVTAGKRVQYDNVIVRKAADGQLIVDGAITAVKIQANTITAAQIAANTITAGQIAALTITAAQIAANTITAAKITAGTITATEIAATTITAAKIAANTITAGQIAAGTITANEIAARSITVDKMLIGVSSNTIPNPGFESGSTAPHTTVGTATLTISTAQKNNGANSAILGNLPTTASGAYAYRMTAGGSPLSTTTSVPAKLGDQFHLEAYFRTNNVAGVQCRVYIDEISASGTRITNSAGSTVTTTTTFQASTLDYTVANATCAYVMLNIAIANTTAGDSVYVDDMMLSQKITGSLVVNGAIDGQTITGATLQTASGTGQRVVVRNDGSGGIIEFFADSQTATTRGFINPGVNADLRPMMTLSSGWGGPTGTTASLPAQVRLISNHLFSAPVVAKPIFQILNGTTLEVQDSASLQAGATIQAGLTVTGGADFTGAVTSANLITTTGGTGFQSNGAGGGFTDNSLSGGGVTGASIGNAGKLQRTSTITAKEAIKEMTAEEARSVLKLKSYTGKYKHSFSPNDPRRYPFFIAEQGAEVGAELWVGRQHKVTEDKKGKQKITRDKNGEIIYFRTAEITVAHNHILADHDSRLERLEAALHA